MSQELKFGSLRTFWSGKEMVRLPWSEWTIHGPLHTLRTTMREANDRGYECLLVADATESYFPEFKQATIDIIRAQGGIVDWTAMAQQVIACIESFRSL